MGDENIDAVSQTVTAPFKASKVKTIKAAGNPMARYTLVAPKFPEPTLLKSTPFILAKITENGIAPINICQCEQQPEDSWGLDHDAKLATSSKTCSAK